MRTAGTLVLGMMTLIAAAASIGCSKSEDKAATAPSASASTPPAPSATPSAPASVPAPSATAAAPPVDCPKGSSGDGTFAKPCDGKGAARMMEVTWTGKSDDKGPSFKVTNKSSATILYGKMAVYFYDKAGKPISVKDTSATPPKDRPYHTCSGNMFQGVMKPGEKAVITFSCVKKENVPDDAKAIEAEMQMVGFTDESGKKIAYYWRNADLTPDERKKGGVK